MNIRISIQSMIKIVRLAPLVLFFNVGCKFASSLLVSTLPNMAFSCLAQHYAKGEEGILDIFELIKYFFKDIFMTILRVSIIFVTDYRHQISA